MGFRIIGNDEVAQMASAQAGARATVRFPHTTSFNSAYRKNGLGRPIITGFEWALGKDTLHYLKWDC